MLLSLFYRIRPFLIALHYLVFQPLGQIKWRFGEKHNVKQTLVISYCFLFILGAELHSPSVAPAHWVWLIYYFFAITYGIIFLVSLTVVTWLCAGEETEGKKMIAAVFRIFD